MISSKRANVGREDEGLGPGRGGGDRLKPEKSGHCVSN